MIRTVCQKHCRTSSQQTSISSQFRKNSSGVLLGPVFKAPVYEGCNHMRGKTEPTAINSCMAGLLGELSLSGARAWLPDANRLIKEYVGSIPQSRFVLLKEFLY